MEISGNFSVDFSENRMKQGISILKKKSHPRAIEQKLLLPFKYYT